jgi:hypothetical protein
MISNQCKSGQWFENIEGYDPLKNFPASAVLISALPLAV